MLGKRTFDRHFVKICTLTPFSIFRITQRILKTPVGAQGLLMFSQGGKRARQLQGCVSFGILADTRRAFCKKPGFLNRLMGDFKQWAYALSTD